MQQGSEVAATTDTRRFLHALRPVVMLGGFVMMWWLLATGAAQASDGPHHDLGSTTTSVTKAVDKAVHHREHRATRSHHAAPQVTRTARHQVDPVIKRTVSTVRSTVHQSPVAPTVKVIHTVVAPVVAKAHKALETTAGGPVVAPALEGLESVQHQTVRVTESSTLQGETASKHPVNTLTSKAAFGVIETTSTKAPTSSSDVTLRGQRHAAPSTPLGSPLGQGGDDRTLASTGSSTASGQSGAGAGPVAGLCESGLDIVPGTTGTLTSAPSDRLDAGPAYPPSSSPD